MKNLLCLPLIVIFSIFLNACGALYTTTKVKDYKIHVDSNDPEVLETVDELVRHYNSEFGAEVLTIVSDVESANSHIGFVKGMRKSGNKLGTGQWLTVTSQDQGFSNLNDSTVNRTVVYSMRLNFDLENFRSKMASRYDKAGGSWRHLYHLFCHEVGHGFQLNHEKKVDSVMYKSIPENSRLNVDYTGYFEQARKFFSR